MKKRGPKGPRLKIEVEQVVALAKLGATSKEMAAFFHCSEQTIEQRFGEQMKEGKSQMKLSLRRAQLKVAIENENPALLIWLGKQYLKQTDGPAVDININNIANTVKDDFLDELEELKENQRLKDEELSAVKDINDLN
jgi:hypothetical protein